MSPYVSAKQRAYLHIHEPAIAARWDKEYGGKVKKKLPTNKKEMIEYRNTHKSLGEKVKGLLKLKNKYKIGVNNKLKGALGQMDPKTNVIEINVKKHKGDRAELASTIKHELMHVEHPKMTEKQVYKKTAKTKIAPMEQDKLIAKLRNKKLNYKMGGLKRKFKMDKSESVSPGSFISRMNDEKRVAIMGLI